MTNPTSMPDFRDTSRIPDHSAYWDALTERIAANAVLKSRASGFEWLAQSRAGWVAASLVLAAALVSMVSAVAPQANDSNSEWVQVLAPADDVGRAITVSDDPPPIGTLLAGRRGGT